MPSSDIIMFEEEEEQWFAMRDLKRSNARNHAYIQLAGRVSAVFTPLVDRIVTYNGHKELVKAPFIPDLLFVKSSRSTLDPIVQKLPTLQYRFKRGGKYMEPITVRTTEMDRFIETTRCASSYKYYTPEEVSPALYGTTIEIIGGSLDGYTGRLMTHRGSKVKRLIIELEGILAVGVEVEAEYIRVKK